MTGPDPDPSGLSPAESTSILIRNATIVTMNDRLDILTGDVVVRDGRIVSVGGNDSGRHSKVIDAVGGYLLPGFIQTHIHLCQTLFRGSADDMPLLEWLKRRVWPMEAAHTPATLRASVRLAAAELLLSGTTSVLTMETVHDTDVVFETLAEIGLRGSIGKCMMDAAAEAPARLQEQTAKSIDESVALKKRWDGAANGRLRAAFAPRFAVSCSRDLLEAVADLASASADARSHARVRVAGRGGGGSPPVRRILKSRVPCRHRSGKRAAVCSALRVGHGTRAGTAGGTRRQGPALSRIEFEARVRAGAGYGDAGPRHLGLPRR